MIAGIYKITNEINNKCYIGISHDVFTRINVHFESNSSNLKADIDKYGLINFKFELLDVVDENGKLNHSEAYYIRKFNSIKHGYNINKGSAFTHYNFNTRTFYL